MPAAQALIIDDSPTNILVLQQLLSIEDVASVAISTTRDLAFQLDSITNIQVVFLDLEMPVVDGYEALQTIKDHPNFTNARVIAYSVHVSELNRAMELGFDGFLGKPLSAEAFPNQLARIFQGEQVCYAP